MLLINACKPDIKKHTLNIAVASNMQFAMDSISKAFYQVTEIESNIIVSSSGKLTAQIQAGAPFDVFLSANMQYPELLYEKGNGISPPEIYAYGSLVLWSVKFTDSLNLSRLNSSDFKNIAIANNRTAPYGKAGFSALTRSGNYEDVIEKLVFGESISQTNQFIASGAADVGFTSKSTVLSTNMKKIGSWIEIDPILYDPIKQGIILLKSKDETKMEMAKSFKQFLFSKKGQQILQNFGYLSSIEKSQN